MGRGSYRCVQVILGKQFAVPLAKYAELFFFPDVPVVVVPADKQVDMYDLLVLAGFFSSKGQARKNWKQTGPAVPVGLSEYRAGNKILAVLNPAEYRPDWTWEELCLDFQDPTKELQE